VSTQYASASSGELPSSLLDLLEHPRICATITSYLLPPPPVTLAAAVHILILPLALLSWRARQLLQPPSSLFEHVLSAAPPLSQLLRLQLYMKHPPLNHKYYHELCRRSPSTPQEVRIFADIEKDVNRGIYGTTDRGRNLAADDDSDLYGDDELFADEVDDVIRIMSERMVGRGDRDEKVFRNCGVGIMASFIHRDSTYHSQRSDRVWSNLSLTEAPSQLQCAPSFAIGSCSAALDAPSLTARKSVVRSVTQAVALAFPDTGYCQGMDYVIGHVSNVVWDGVRECTREFVAIVKQQREFARLLYSNGGNGDGDGDGDAETVNTHATGTSAAATYTFFVDQLDSLMSNRFFPTGQTSVATHVELVTFSIVSHLFEDYNVASLFKPGLRLLLLLCDQLKALVAARLPVLSDHLENSDINLQHIVLSWYQTMFIYLPNIPRITVSRIWDVFFVSKSYAVFHKVALALFGLTAPLLLNMGMEEIFTFFQNLPVDLLNEEVLLKCAGSVELGRDEGEYAFDRIVA
jgi:hypothetical protein